MALHIPQSAIDEARKCPEAFACLADIPQCQVTVDITYAHALVVSCQEIGSCPYKTGRYRRHGEQQMICSCPVRLAFWSEHSL